MRKGNHYGLKVAANVKPQIFGRDAIIDDIRSKLESGKARVAIVKGKPGEGKLTVAAEVLRQVG